MFFVPIGTEKALARAIKVLRALISKKRLKQEKGEKEKEAETKKQMIKNTNV